MNKEQLLEKFINYFDNGYKFEKFCKILLNWLDFDDIKVTKRSGDNGIDLTCNKKEITALDLNTINYIVQAKCYSKGHKVSSKEIREFKGTTTDTATRRIFITTSDYSKNAIYEASDHNTPVTLINGIKLIEYCISLQDKVFDVKHYFNKEKLDDLFNEDNQELNIIERKITKNDVRARILRFPSEYKEILKDKKKYMLSINKTTPKYYNLNKDNTYFGGITSFYKDFISNLDFEEARSIWKHDKEKNIIYIEIK